MNRSEGSPESERRLLCAQRIVTAYAIAQTGLLLGLVWKWGFFRWADEVYQVIPLHHDFFPSWLRSQDTLRWVYLGGLVSIAIGLVGIFPWIRRITAVCATGCLLVLCWHQGSYNDATFTTSLWCSLWVLWLSTQLEANFNRGFNPAAKSADEMQFQADPETILRKGAWLARAICSMVLLGGAIGKWTPEYWSGDVFFDIYFRDRDFWLFNYLRDNNDQKTLRWMATWYSRNVILVESVAGIGLWLLPARWAAVVGVVLFASIALFSNFLLFSVLWCLIGLSAIGFLVPAKAKS